MKDLLRYFNAWERRRIKSFEKEEGLIDDCKYMLILQDDFAIWEDEKSFPCKSIREAKEFINGYCN